MSNGSQTLQADPQSVRSSFQLLPGDPAVKRTDRKRFDALTALRFFPLICVVFHHSQDSFSCWRHIGDFFNMSQATAFFFVFSGFVLAHNYSRLEGTRDIFRFYLLRLSRIWPVHVFCLVLLIALLPEVFRVTTEHIPKFLCNLFLIQAWIPSWKIFFSYNAASWTSSALIAMYLCFPLLARAINRCWYMVLAGAATLVLVSILMCNYLHLPECSYTGWTTPGIVYINPISRMLEFVVGMVAAYFFARYAGNLKLSTLSVTLLEVGCIAGILWLNISSQAIRAASIPWATNAGSLWLSNSGAPLLLCAAVILIFALQRGLLSRLLSTRFFVKLGEISFSIYMLHCIFLAYRGIRYPQHDSPLDATLYVLLLFISATVLTMAFEKPVRKLVMKLADRFLFSRDKINAA